MAQANYAADQTFERVRQPANDFEGPGLAVSIFADGPHRLAEMREDAVGAGLTVGQCGDLSLLLEDGAIPLGDVVLVDCFRIDAARLAALARLDMRASKASAQLVVATSVAALDEVFGCLDQSGAQILVDPGRGDRVLALGRARAQRGPARLRELSEEDRLHLLRLTQQVEEIANRLDQLGFDRPDIFHQRGGSDTGPSQVEAPGSRYRAPGGKEDESERLRRAVRPPLPDPRLVRRIIRQRQLRARFFDADLFADPAWDMLLDLTAARVEHKRVSVTSLCIASGVPPTTALRWIGQMIEAGLLDRIEDETDRRRAFIALSDRAADSIARYFAELGKVGAQMV